MTVPADLPNLRREYEALKARVETLERQLERVPTRIADLAGPDGDVDLTGLSNGDTLEFDVADGKWHPV